MSDVSSKELISPWRVGRYLAQIYCVYDMEKHSPILCLDIQ